MDINKILVSTFAHVKVTDNPVAKPLPEILEEIKKGNSELKKRIDKIRKEKDHNKQGIFKTLLLSVFCVSGIFSQRKDADLVSMTGAICLDLDDIADIKGEKKRLKEYPYVLSIFRSPSGNGLKVIVLHDLTDSSRHKDLYNHLATQIGLTGRTDLKFDTSCSNVSRACFISYDPDLYLSKKAEPFHINPATLPVYTLPVKDSSEKSKSSLTPDKHKPTIPVLTDPKKIKNKIVETHALFEEYYSMYPGTRNANLFILASFLKDKGIPEENATDYLVAYYCDPKNGFPASEIEDTVCSAYMIT